MYLSNLMLHVNWWNQEFKEVYQSQAAEKKKTQAIFGKSPTFLKGIKNRQNHVCFILDFSNLSDIIIIKKHFEIQMNLLKIRLL